MFTFEQLKPGYLDLWQRAKVVRTAATKVQVDAIKRAQKRLMGIEVQTGVPWFVVGALLVREAGLRNGELDFKAVLHNGERIVGTGRKTTLVPRGLGPFSTWEEAALDAIRREGLDKLNWHGTDGIAAVAYAAEKFNGFGYRYRGIPSPYLWGGTSVQQRGKFVADGVFDRTVMDQQIGIMAVIKMFQGVPTVQATAPVIMGAAVGSAAVATEHWNLWSYWPYGLAVVVAGLIIFVLYKGYKNAQDVAQ